MNLFSGGPIQIADRDASCIHDVIGITSYGPPSCGRAKSYGIYTNVSYYLDWIEKIVWRDEWDKRETELEKDPLSN